MNFFLLHNQVGSLSLSSNSFLFFSHIHTLLFVAFQLVKVHVLSVSRTVSPSHCSVISPCCTLWFPIITACQAMRSRCNQWRHETFDRLCLTIYAVTLTKTAISKESIGLFGRYTNSDVVIQGHLDEISTLHLKISLIVTDQLAERTRWPVYDFTCSCKCTRLSWLHLDRIAWQTVRVLSHDWWSMIHLCPSFKCC